MQTNETASPVVREKNEAGRPNAPRYFRAPQVARASWEKACVCLREKEEYCRNVADAERVVSRLLLGEACRREVENALSKEMLSAKTDVRLAEEACEAAAGEWRDSEWYFRES